MSNFEHLEKQRYFTLELCAKLDLNLTICPTYLHVTSTRASIGVYLDRILPPSSRVYRDERPASFTTRRA